VVPRWKKERKKMVPFFAVFCKKTSLTLPLLMVISMLSSHMDGFVVEEDADQAGGFVEQERMMMFLKLCDAYISNLFLDQKKKHFLVQFFLS